MLSVILHVAGTTRNRAKLSYKHIQRSSHALSPQEQQVGCEAKAADATNVDADEMKGDTRNDRGQTEEHDLFHCSHITCGSHVLTNSLNNVFQT